jgi:hypothetical protein
MSDAEAMARATSGLNAAASGPKMPEY